MIGGEIGRPGLELDRPGNADPDAPERAGAGFRDALVEERLDPLEHGVRPGGDVGVLLPVHDDLARQVGERHVGARRAEVGDEEIAGVGAETEQPRCAAAGRDADAVLREQAALEQRRDALDQDRAAEAGRGAELGTRRRPVGPDVVEHGDEAVWLGRGAGPGGHFGSECKDICSDRQDFS